jgi:hypothetical protein
MVIGVLLAMTYCGDAQRPNWKSLYRPPYDAWKGSGGAENYPEHKERIGGFRSGQKWVQRHEFWRGLVERNIESLATRASPTQLTPPGRSTWPGASSRHLLGARGALNWWRLVKLWWASSVIPESQREIEGMWSGGETLGFTWGSQGGFIARDKVKFVTLPTVIVEMRRRQWYCYWARISSRTLPVGAERIRSTSWRARCRRPVSRGGRDVSGIIAVSLRQRKKGGRRWPHLLTGGSRVSV